MKQLKLSIINLGAIEILTREQMKRVMAGSGCAFTFNSAHQTGTVSIPSSSFIDVVTESDGSKTTTVYGTSMKVASQGASNGGTNAHWCCDGCAGASWYHPS